MGIRDGNISCLYTPVFSSTHIPVPSSAYTSLMYSLVHIHLHTCEVHMAYMHSFWPGELAHPLLSSPLCLKQRAHVSKSLPEPEERSYE